jgi:hypothetical protein
MSSATPESRTGARAGRSLPRRIVAGLVYLLVVVVLAELGLRAVLSTDWALNRLWGRSPYGTRIAVIARAGSSATAPDPTRVSHPLLGWKHPSGVVIIGATAHVSRQGLRGLREYAPSKPPGVTRVAVFGDSFAFGAEVDDELCYPALLEQERPRTEVLNFGALGYGLDQMLLRFREEGRAYGADVVVIGLTSVMLPRTTASFTYWYKPYFVRAGDRLVLRGVPVPGLDEARRRQRYGSRIVDVVRALRWERRLDPPLDLAILEQFVAEIGAAGARPVIVLYPATDEYLTGSRAAGLFRDACAATHATCIDTSAAFAAAAARGAQLTANSHFSPAGHRLVADALAAELGPATSR